jgi:3-hydroxyacyl-[acyl-carrier-protein] dehydratase
MVFDSIGIQECQRNRYPLLFVDKVIEVIPGKSAHGIKNFTYNEWFFPAHFDDEPTVPGFVQVEALAQTFLMTFLCIDEYKGKKASALSHGNVKFKRKIVPGDRLDIYATLDSFRRGLAKGHVESFVDNAPACSAEFMIAIDDIIAQFKPKQ